MKTMLIATTLFFAAGCGTEPGLFRADGARAVQGSGLDDGAGERGTNEEAAAEREGGSTEREAPPAGEGTGAPVGEYRGYFCSAQQFILTLDITEADALANCQLNAAANPQASVACTWNGQRIFTNELTAGECDVLPEGGQERSPEEAIAEERAPEEQAADGRVEEEQLDEGRTEEERSADRRALCGLFRGGLDEASNMIASPNLPESIDDSDEACRAYCDASGAQAGDLCVRGGIILQLYTEAPAEGDERE
jgi:hypothetical protein